MAKGACNCGSISFEISATITDIYICHCSICRRATGSNGIAIIVVDNDHFGWLSGQNNVNRWKKPDADWEIWFCKLCGSPVPGHNDELTMFVPAGSITEGGEELKVADHIWVGSKAHWDEIGDSGRHHTEGFER